MTYWLLPLRSFEQDFSQTETNSEINKRAENPGCHWAELHTESRMIGTHSPLDPGSTNYIPQTAASIFIFAVKKKCIFQAAAGLSAVVTKQRGCDGALHWLAEAQRAAERHMT